MRSKVFYGIIADGLHAHATSVSIAYQSHPKGAILVTDAMSALGLPDGIHKLGDSKLEIQSTPFDGMRFVKKAVLKGTDTLAGAVVSMIDCVRNFRDFTNCSIAEALNAATLRPAEALGIDNVKGSLDFGMDGDILVLDENTLRVETVYIRGRCVFKLNEKLE